jgi:alpha-galactosidase
VIKKEATLYYAFYAKKWKGKIELRGLDENVTYTVVDYFNTKDLGEVSSDNPIIDVSFKDFLLLEVNLK